MGTLVDAARTSCLAEIRPRRFFESGLYFIRNLAIIARS
jgi:hypothetical protein